MHAFFLIKFTFHFCTAEAKRWLGPESECDWAGILCDESNKIRSIDIHGQGIQGTLPDSFTRLPYLQTIAIQWNNFTGPLPPQFGLMKHLIHLEMHYNQFTGTFPATWSNARNLQLVNIANNRLTGQLPADIGNFRNLKGLYLYNNDFSGTLPPQLSNAKTLGECLKMLSFVITFSFSVSLVKTLFDPTLSDAHVSWIDGFLQSHNTVFAFCLKLVFTNL